MIHYSSMWNICGGIVAQQSAGGSETEERTRGPALRGVDRGHAEHTLR